MKTIEIPIRGGVECGKPVPVDWNKWAGESVRQVSQIRNKVPFAHYETYPVSGESLKAAGIHDGDFLICRETAFYVPGRIGVWQTPNGQTAKYADIEREGFVVLHNKNGWREEWSVEDIRLIALVVRVERDYE